MPLGLFVVMNLLSGISIKHPSLWEGLVRLLHLVIQTRPEHGIRSYLAIGYSDMGRMNGIALESLRTFKCTVEHYVAVA